MDSWVKSSFCADKTCVEACWDGELVLVRDSKHPERVLSFTRAEWSAFLDGAKAGEFD